MQVSGSPRFAGTRYYRYHDWEQRVNMASTVRKVHDPNHHTTSVAWFSDPSDGVVKVEIRDLADNVDDPMNTEWTRQAESRLEKAVHTLNGHMQQMYTYLQKTMSPIQPISGEEYELELNRRKKNRDNG